MAWVEDWTGSNELRGNLEPYLLELQVALNERVDITNARQDKIGTITKPSFLTTPIQSTKLWSIKTIMTQVEALVDDLIPEFVNSTDSDEYEASPIRESGGDPHPLTPWAEAALLSHISETRIDHSALKEWSWDWLSQQQKILNNLRWTRQDLPNLSIPGATVYHREATGATFAAAVIAWNATSWSSGTAASGLAFTHNIDRSKQGLSALTSVFEINRHRFEYQPTSGSWVLDAPTITQEYISGSPTSSPKKTYNIYTPFDYPTASGDSEVAVAYENNDYEGGNRENSIIIKEETPTNSSVMPAISVGNLDTVTATDPGAGTRKGYRYSQSSPSAAVFQVFLLYKWDVLGGLEKAS